ncbi:MAG: GxxExxY protein [Kiritimatiellae bacterium]|nr:GxxExxY protein [Kiritimatiellia bacterium]
MDHRDTEGQEDRGFRSNRNMYRPDGILNSVKQYPCKDITERVIGCAITVHRELSSGFVESVYENALVHELTKQSIAVEQQKIFQVFYDGCLVGVHRADLIVEGQVVVELKAVCELTAQHISQLMSTMKAARLKVGLLINFAESRLIDGVKRVVL